MDSTTAGTNSEIFDPTKEKKKKKKKVLDLDSVLLGSTTTQAPTQDEDTQQQNADQMQAQDNENGSGDLGQHDDILESLESFGNKKKKKKVKKVVLLDEEELAGVVDGSGAPGEEEALDFDFSKTKKKKKKGGVTGLDELVAKDMGEDDVEDFESVVVLVEEEQDKEGGDQLAEEEVVQHHVASAAEQPDDDPSSMGGGDDLLGGDDDNDDGEMVSVPAPQQKTWLSSDRDYTYDELLTRVFEIMRAKNPEMVSGTKQKFVMRPPQVVRIGTKKTSFVNFMEICKMLHRHQKHLLDFLLSELGTSGSIDGNNQLIIKGRFQQKQIENVLRRYIKEYVTCHTCKSPNTLLQKDFRLFFLQCEACGSRCSVASIKHGFQAVTGKRAAMRAKAN